MQNFDKDIFIDLHKKQRENTQIQDPGFKIEKNQLFVRYTGPDSSVYSNGIVFTAFNGLKEDAVRNEVQAQISYFSKLQRSFEWKHLDYDFPSNLPEILIKEGFRIERTESVMAASTKLNISVPHLPDISIKEISEESFDDIGLIKEKVDKRDFSSLVASIKREKRAQPNLLRVFVAYNGGQPVSCAWLRMDKYLGWMLAGSTVEEFRGRGIYQHLTKIRIELARQQGLKFVATDAGTMSEPILEKIGFQKVAKVTRFYFDV